MQRAEAMGDASSSGDPAEDHFRLGTESLNRAQCGQAVGHFDTALAICRETNTGKARDPV